MDLRKILGLPEQEVDVSALVDDAKQPRAQHYIFAHRFLPALTFQMGVTTVLILANPEKSDLFLHKLWNDVAEKNEIPLDEQITPDPLNATVERVGDKLIAIVQLPPPQAVTEAHFVAIVSDLPPEPGDDDAPESIEALRQQLRQTPLRYFSLENGYSLDNTPRTAFCEWTKEGHLNMGDGPKPTREAFLGFLSAGDFPAIRADNKSF